MVVSVFLNYTLLFTLMVLLLRYITLKSAMVLRGIYGGFFKQQAKRMHRLQN